MLTDQALNNLPENPNVSVAEAGKDTLLYLNQGTVDAPDWLIIGGQRNTPLSRKANTLDASHKTSGGWGSTVPGLKSWSIDYSGLQIMSDNALQIIDYCFINDKQVNVKIAYKNGSYRTGWAYITEYNDDNAHDAIGTVKITLEGNGPISELITAVIAATIDKTAATFSKATPTDAAFTITPPTTLVSAVKNGSTALKTDTDYSYTNGILTIKQSYLGAQSNGNAVINVTTDSTAFTLTIAIGA